MKLLTEIIQRFVGFFILGLIPISLIYSQIKSLENEKIVVVLLLLSLIWMVYANAWCKLAVSLFNSESTTWVSAYAKGRTFLNADILTKLAYLPLVGFIFDRWINRKPPEETGNESDDTL